MRIKAVMTIFLMSFFLNCGDKNSENLESETLEANQQKKTISVSVIENLKYQDYILSGDSEKEVRDWSKFQELSTQISFLKQADVSFFTSEKDTLKVFLDSLKSNVPEIINNNAVNARILALETKLLKLNNDLLLENYNVDYKIQSIKELLIANSNLIYVINRKIDFDKIDREAARPYDK